MDNVRMIKAIKRVGMWNFERKKTTTREHLEKFFFAAAGTICS
jgi:hypothetical protein